MSADRPSGMHRVFSDVVDLALLQLQLLAVDGREAGRRGLGAILYLGLAAALLVSTATVALFGFGWVLHEIARWPLGWSLLAVAGLALLLVLAILGLAYLSIKNAASAMQEVGAEFADNLEWLRAVAGSPTPRRPPSSAGPYAEGPYAESPYAESPYAGGAYAGGSYAGGSYAGGPGGSPASGSGPSGPGGAPPSPSGWQAGAPVGDASRAERTAGESPPGVYSRH